MSGMESLLSLTKQTTGGFPMSSLLTHNEALAWLRDASLPENFGERLRNQLEFDACSNCDNVRCMHFVMRDWWDSDFDQCDRWCCPFCSDLKETEWATKG